MDVIYIVFVTSFIFVNEVSRNSLYTLRKMNEEVGSFLSEKVSNLLLIWEVNSSMVDNKSSGLSLRQ